MEPYVPYLKSYAGKIPLVCGDYGSSECTVGINLNPKSPPEHVSFTLVPDAAYFEFFPMEQKGGTELPVDITGVQIGEEYEVIVTTVAGNLCGTFPL
jgi:jasmonic acid-amino synthetase